MGDVLRIVLDFHNAEARVVSEMSISAKRAIEQLETSQESVEFCVHLMTTFANELQESFERRSSRCGLKPSLTGSAPA
jgi:hypothetical protein